MMLANKSTLHSLLGIMQLKTVIIVGAIVTITFVLLLYYSISQPEELNKSPQNVFNPHLLVEHRPLIKKKDKLQVVSKKDSKNSVKDYRPALSSPRLAKYCNHAQNHMEGQEGLAPSQYKLLAVHTVTRHGDRSPVYKLLKGVSSDLSCLMDMERYSHLSKVVNFPHIMAAEMSKKNRTALLRWSLFPSRETCEVGQLTGQGAIQHILNGIHFSERYIHKHGLFSADNWHRNVVIHSTETSRTYQSAIAFAYGMLPNFDINRLVVKTSLEVNFCDTGQFGVACKCSQMEKFKVKAEAKCKTNPRVKKSYRDYINMSFVRDVLHISPLAVPGAISLMDGLSGYTCHNIPYPCNTNGSCITTSDMEALWKVIDTKSECMSNSQSYRTHSRAFMHGLLFRIGKNVNISRVNSTNAKFHLYSGHHSSLIPLIAALELTDNTRPGYANMITFELWKDMTNMKDYIKVLQNGLTVTHEVIFCKDKKPLKNGMCSFKHFLAYLNSRNLRSFCFSSKKGDTNFF